MSGPAKKRDAPNLASPVVHNKVRYEVAKQQAESWGSDPQPDTAEMVLFAMDAGDGRELWRAKLYDVRYDPAMERDKQEVYVTSLSLNLLRTKLKATDEKGRRYTVDLKSHAVVRA